MRAVIKDMHSPDIDITSEQVGDSTDFGLLLQLKIGPLDAPGEESFDVIVCTPAWISRQVEEQGPLIGRHHLIVNTYDLRKIIRYLKGRVEALEAETWPALAEKIGRLGRWEFEDYSGG